jgi:4-amino-4-deoxy-L-arabinose transferase-like glycosyltransferase
MKNTLLADPSMKPESAAKALRSVYFESLNILFLLAVCFGLFLWKLGALPFFERGEPREALVVWEMYSTGNWILPIINGEYIPFKPPLFHWLGVLVAIVVGRVDEFTVRFPSALLGTLGVLMTYYVGERLWTRKAGLVAAVVLATSFEWWQAATITQVDMTLVFSISAALMLFCFLYREERSRAARSLVLALLLALGTLAKGPLGVAVPVFVILLFLWLQRNLVFLKELPLAAGATLFLLVAGSWYGLALIQQGWSFFQRQIVDETLLTGIGSYGRHQPFYYFIPVLFYNTLPWSLFFPGLAVFLYQRRGCLAEDQLLYPLVWFAGVLFFFSVALGKRGVYILPLYPATALLFGVWWSLLEQGKAGGVKLTQWMGGLYALSWGVVITAICIYFIGAFGLSDRRFVIFMEGFGNLAPVLHSLSRHFFAVGIGLLLSVAWLSLLVRFLLKKKWAGVFGCLTVIALVQILVIKHAYYPYFADQRTMKPFMSRVVQKIDSGAPLLFYRAFDYSVVFYARRHIPSYTVNSVRLKLPYFLLMWEEDFKRLSAKNHFQVLDISEGRGPAARHRLLLLERQENSPIIDPKGYEVQADE